MRLLFVMPYPGHLRMYGSTINALAERGHEVLLAYDRPDKRSETPLLPAGAPPSVRFAGEVPWDRGEWGPLVRLLRLSADYARFLDPRFADAQPLRDRMDKFLPERVGFLRRADPLPLPVAKLMLWAFRRIERALPPDVALRAFLESLRPDALVVTPVVVRGELGVKQTEAVKAGRSLGIPTAVAVGSWDHLTSKGLLRGEPDRLLVWNEVQRQEAVRLHGVPEGRVVVTGAQLFDRWFDMRPGTTAGEFIRHVGLPPDRPFVLYAGSSRGIAEPESELRFVRRWVAALRSSSDPRVRDLGVLVRPHPFNMDHWQGLGAGSEAGLAVFPRERPGLPMSAGEEADFFRSLHFSSAVMGINTSAMIEAAIVGRPVFTIRAPEFRRTQDGTVHFRYLIPEGGGAVQVAEDLEEHLQQLAHTLENPEQAREDLRAFVGRFVRPRGLARPADPILVEEIETLARLRTAPRPDVPPALWALSWALRLLARRLAPRTPDAERERRRRRRRRRRAMRRSRRRVARSLRRLAERARA